MAEKDARANAGLAAQPARVLEILSKYDGAIELLVELADRELAEKALLYPALCPQPIAIGDSVLVNTTAVDLNLGTGGYHFVIAKLTENEPVQADTEQPGHIMKLRYTPVQVRCLSVEEQDSLFHATLKEAETISGMPVVVASLHSQLAPIAAAIKAQTAGRAKIAYIMTDHAALALGFSKLVERLREKQLIDITITAGQAFGGDFEAINVYSALLAARLVAQADVAIVAQGPGNIGTGTRFGFGAIYQGEVVNAASVLGGQPVAALRISFADGRPRHQGISEQCLLSMAKIALCPAKIALPRLAEEKLLYLQQQLNDRGICARHEIVIADSEFALAELGRLGLEVTSMGRNSRQDREFFLAAAAAGVVAAQQLSQ